MSADLHQEKTHYVVAPIDRLGRPGIQLRQMLLACILRTTWIVQFMQELRRPQISGTMKFFSFLGLEEFFTPLILLSVWILDAEFGKLYLFVLAAGFYCASFLKCLLCLPRPPTPPIRPMTLENKDWAFPSNHSVMAILMPWYTWLYVTERHHLPLPLQLLFVSVCVVWTAGVNLSRLYLGVHSPPDLIAGSLIGLVLLRVFRYFSPYLYFCYLVRAGLMTICGGVLMFGLLWTHPRTWPETQSFGETLVPFFACFGMLLGRSFSWSPHPPAPLLLLAPESSWVLFCCRAFLRFSLGCLVVLGFRAAVKRRTRQLAIRTLKLVDVSVYSSSLSAQVERQLPKHFSVAYRLASPVKAAELGSGRLTDGDLSPERTVRNGMREAERCSRWLPSHRRPVDADIPTKFVVYVGMGFLVAEFCPFLFLQLGI